MSQTKIANQIKQLTLTPQEIEAVVACLIGDGTLCKSGNGKYYRLRVEHTALHKEYVEWKHTLLKRLCISPIQYIPSNDSYKVGTVGHPTIKNLRKAWYSSNVKQVSLDFRLTPLILAIWFMDDGTRHNKTVDISVHNFSESSIQILRNELSRYQIETTVNSDSKGNRLYIRTKGYPNFKRLVKPYIIECMAYKLP